MKSSLQHPTRAMSRQFEEGQNDPYIKTGDKSDPIHNRPISVLQIIASIFERPISNQNTIFMDKHEKVFMQNCINFTGM